MLFHTIIIYSVEDPELEPHAATGLTPQAALAVARAWFQLNYLMPQHGEDPEFVKSLTNAAKALHRVKSIKALCKWAPAETGVWRCVYRKTSDALSSIKHELFRG